MFPQGVRLKAGRPFAQVLRKGQKGSTPFFRLRWQANLKGQHRVAVVVSRKFSTKAVRRNRIKRQVRALLTNELPSLKKIDLVIYVNQQAYGKNYQDLTAELRQALKKNNLYA
ncbi:ribonuclease P protein component [Candidatus Berkelbacteria bacterium]|nr:ribonuclease P protein component [Candidatus Berkelbacteria bacterium]